MAKLATLTISSMMFIGFASWPRATAHRLGGGSVASRSARTRRAAAPPRRRSAPRPRRHPSAPSHPALTAHIGGEVLRGMLHGGHLNSPDSLRLTRTTAAGLVSKLDMLVTLAAGHRPPPGLRLLLGQRFRTRTPPSDSPHAATSADSRIHTHRRGYLIRRACMPALACRCRGRPEVLACTPSSCLSYDLAGANQQQ